MAKDNTLKLYRSTTANAVPGASTLAAGELAVNLTDKRLYVGDAAGTSYHELTRRAAAYSPITGPGNVTIGYMNVQLADNQGMLTGPSFNSTTWQPDLGWNHSLKTLYGYNIAAGFNLTAPSFEATSDGINGWKIIQFTGNSSWVNIINSASDTPIAIGDSITVAGSGIGLYIDTTNLVSTFAGDLQVQPDINANTTGFVSAMGGFGIVPDTIGNASGDLRFYEATASGGNYVGFKAPSTIAANKIWTLPSADGTNGQVLSTNGSATLSWVSNTLAAGSDTQVQFNDGGTNLGGDAGLTYNKTTDALTIAGDLAVNGGDITCSVTTFNLLNSTVTTLNMGGAATAIAIGASTGTTTFANTIKAPVGTATLAPILMQSGTNLTTATSGAIEYDGKCFYATTAGGRTLLSGEHYAMVSATRTISNVNTAQAVFDSANDVITLAANTTYMFEGFYRVISGTTTHTTNMGFAEVSVGTVGTWYWLAVNHGATAGTVSRAQDTTVFTSATVNSTTGATNSTSASALITIWFRGVVETSTDAVGVTPQICFSAAPGGTNQIGAGSFIRFTPIGSDTAQSIGPWT